jgi:MFS family permease
MSDKSRQFQIFLASFMTLIAAGMGFAIRTDILGEWEAAFGFTKSELGQITGGGLTGFGITIIVCSLFADQFGYRALLLGAFVLHVLSAGVTLAAAPVFEAYGQESTYWCLYVGMFMFALANGMCEAAINPLVATLYPTQKTHYLNILHAGWPGGLVIGALLSYCFVGADAAIQRLPWEAPMCFFLVPTLYYGFVTLKERFPISEARAAGLTFGEMMTEFARPMLLFLFLLHAMVGYVELGTDSWVTDITKNFIRENALLLFVYTSGIMFVLRFFAGPIVERINPLGLLFISAVLASIGLLSLGYSTTGTMIILAATIYGVGKTFFWPTMLGVVGERFPRGGALTMGTIGGIGMLSAGLLGGPGIGYKQDYYASQKLEEIAPETYERYVAKAYYSEAQEKFVNVKEKVDGEWPESYGNVVLKEQPKSFLFFPPISGLDGQKVGALKEKVEKIERKTKKGEPIESSEQLTDVEQRDKEPVLEARTYGGQMALRWTALVPAMMGVGYLILLLYFRSTGGYTQVHLEGPIEALGKPYPGVER